MKKKIVVAASAVVITVGSVFAFPSSTQHPVAGSLGQCPAECCIGGEENCEIPTCCEEEGSTCCIPMH